MKDPFTEPMRVECKAFGKYRVCKVMATPEAKANPLPPYERKELLFVSRNEDMYGSHHYQGKNAVRLLREDWMRAVNDY